MSSMLMKSSGLRAGLFGLIAAVFAPAAMAQDAGQLAQECVRAVRVVALNATQDIQEATEDAIGVIRDLNNSDATNQEILRAGVVARNRIEARADAARERIGTIVQNCVQELRAMDAPQALIARVLDAGRDTRRAVSTAQHRANHRINAAVRLAIED